MTDLDLSKLADHFQPSDIEWRLQQAGKKQNGEIWAKCLAYITNRAIMDRLDLVCGPGNWRNEEPRIVAVPNGPTAFIAGISILVNGHWVTKWDGAEPTDIEPVKGGLSGSMKRAAVQWGIGRYLYDLPEGWAKIAERGEHVGRTKESKPGAKDGVAFRWDNPDLPKWALPEVPKVGATKQMAGGTLRGVAGAAHP